MRCPCPAKALPLAVWGHVACRLLDAACLSQASPHRLALGGSGWKSLMVCQRGRHCAVHAQLGPSADGPEAAQSPIRACGRLLARASPPHHRRRRRQRHRWTSHYSLGRQEPHRYRQVRSPRLLPHSRPRCHNPQRLRAQTQWWKTSMRRSRHHRLARLPPSCHRWHSCCHWRTNLHGRSPGPGSSQGWSSDERRSAGSQMCPALAEHPAASPAKRHPRKGSACN